MRSANTIKKMGKKEGKRAVPSKLQAKKARQALKQEKSEVKRTKKELKDGGEEDIEKIIAEFAAKEAARMAVTINLTPQPSRRANFSITALPSGEMLLFGGEYFDGERTSIYNELYRWNVERNEWRLIESLNTPPPRCSHQAVLYHDKLYLFGGEYATMDQFYHYRDFWELDLKTNAWSEVEATGDLPSARSGHRMIVWRNYLLMFGGFYEAMREIRWFNDLYIFSFQTRRWMLHEYKPNTQIPKPRSGVQLALHSSEDLIYIFGGYSKEKSEGLKQEGKIHEDMWMLNLKPCLPSGKSSNLDLSKAIWQRISRKGDYPSARCGCVVTVYKNKSILFGGVHDTEGPRHALVSTFYNDLYAFDMDRRRWYKLGIKEKKAPMSKIAKAEARKLRTAQLHSSNNQEIHEMEYVNSENEEEEEEGSENNDNGSENFIFSVDGTLINGGVINNKDLFGYIDENGNVVYVNIDEEEEVDDKTEILTLGSDPQTESALVLEPLVPSNIKSDGLLSAEAEEQSKCNPPKLQTLTVTTPKTDLEKSVFFRRHFDEQRQPSPRINPCLMIRGNTLYIYGGVTEIGDVEITLDDCWTLDLNRRDEWKKVLDGTMAEIVWKGEEEEEDGSSRHSHSNFDYDDSDEEEDGESGNSSEENGAESDREQRKQKKATKSGIKAVSRKEEMDMLRSHFDTTDSHRTPLGGESLRDFYSRTAEYWAQTVIQKWQEDQDSTVLNGKLDPLSEKEIKRLGFQMSEMRYQELSPLLSRLNELETDQMQEERFYEKKEKERNGRKHQAQTKTSGKNDNEMQKKNKKN